VSLNPISRCSQSERNNAHRRVVLLRYDRVFPFRKATPERIERTNTVMKVTFEDMLKFSSIGRDKVRIQQEVDRKFQLYRYTHPRNNHIKPQQS
jgi:hypothetical protein